MWLISHDLDTATAAKTEAEERIPFLEVGLVLGNPSRRPHLPPFMSDAMAFADAMPEDAPRVFKSHMPIEFLPPRLLDTCKGDYLSC